MSHRTDRKFWIAPAIGLALMLAVSLPAATYEVAQRHPQASDDAPGTGEQPWKSITKAAQQARAGDVVVIRGGVYRERVLVKSSGTAQVPIRFEAAPGEHVVVTGADRLTGWQKADDTRPIYRVAWPHKFVTWNPTMAHPADEYHRLIGRCEQVMVDGYLLRQVLSAEQLAPGTFLADVTNQTLFVWDAGSRDLTKTHVEASVRQEIFRVEGDATKATPACPSSSRNSASTQAVRRSIRLLRTRSSWTSGYVRKRWCWSRKAIPKGRCQGSCSESEGPNSLRPSGVKYLSSRQRQTCEGLRSALPSCLVGVFWG